MASIVGITADNALDQIYRELGVSVSAGTHYYSGTYPIDKIVYAWIVSVNDISPVIVQPDVEPFITYTTATIGSGGVFKLPANFNAFIAARIGARDLFVSKGGTRLDRVLWRDSSTSGLTSISRYGRTQAIVRGNFSVGDTVSYVYQRRMHPPGLIGNLKYLTTTNVVVESSAKDIADTVNVYDEGILFDVPNSKKMSVQYNNTTTQITLYANPTHAAASSKSALFALPELPQEYVDMMIAATCLRLNDGEDTGGWKERIYSPKSVQITGREHTPYTTNQTLFDSFDGFDT